MSVKLARFILSIAVGMLAAVGAAMAQDYPTRPVTLVVPVAPGGSIDIVARMTGGKLTERLGKPLIVENRPGGATIIAASAVASAASDGYTLLIAPSGTLAINATLYKKLPYDAVKDFAPVALVATVPFVLVVNPEVPVRSVAELVNLAKQRPGELTYASSGAGSAPHLAAELLKSLAGIKMTHVPYKGGAPALNDVIAGHVSLVFGDPGSVLPQIRSGRVRALCVSSTVRIPAAPDIPPIAEAGVPGFDAASWQMIVVPAGTPKEIVNKLHREFAAVMAAPDVRERFASLGLIPVISPPPEELRRFLQSETARWAATVHRAGLAGSE
jgi:tripartite-type tricarboxylate transporter receptor subunit TctC